MVQPWLPWHELFAGSSSSRTVCPTWKRRPNTGHGWYGLVRKMVGQCWVFFQQLILFRYEFMNWCLTVTNDKGALVHTLVIWFLWVLPFVLLSIPLQFSEKHGRGNRAFGVALSRLWWIWWILGSRMGCHSGPTICCLVDFKCSNFITHIYIKGGSYIHIQQFI